MNVLWINHRDPKHPQSGGAEVRIHEIGRRLVEQGCNVVLLCERWKGSGRTDLIDGIQVSRLGGQYGVHFRTFGVLKKMEKTYDIVIDDVAHGVPWFSTMFTKKPVIGQVHHVHREVAKLELPWYLASLVIWSERAVKYFYDTVVTVSESTRRTLVEKLGVPSAKVKVVLNGVDHEIYSPSKKSSDPVILWVGRVRRYKRLEHVVLAFEEVKKHVPNSRLIIVGDGSYLKHIKSFAAKSAIADVAFLGRVDEKDKVRLMGKAWLMVGSSLVEGWGMVVTEGAACGTPFVAYNVPGFRDSIRNGETGVLVEEGNIGAFAACISRILNDQGLRTTLSENAVAFSRKFNWDESARLFMDVLQRLENA